MNSLQSVTGIFKNPEPNSESESQSAAPLQTFQKSSLEKIQAIGTAIQETVSSIQKHNQYQKWQKYGFSSRICTNHPEFCQFLGASNLLSQIKVTKDQPFEIENEAALLVEGRPMKWPEIKEKFELVYSKGFDETFIINKASREVYTYLDNRKGLQKYHPFLTKRKVISFIDSDEHQKILNKAHAFIRPEETSLSCEERNKRNEERKHILQIVSSYVRGGNTRFHELLMNPKHPYVRLVIGHEHKKLNMYMGEVYEVGYRLKNKITLPFTATQGRFRSPDLSEYASCEERIVTNIPITSGEALAFYNFTEKYHRESINLGHSVGFHFATQNCSTYVRKALAEASITVPTEISLFSIIRQVAPAWFSDIAICFNKIKKSLHINSISNILPNGIQTKLGKMAEVILALTRKIFDAIAAFFVSVLHILLGDAIGDGGQAFVSSNEPPQKIQPGLTNWKKWFSLSRYCFNLPGILQEWQRKQASTVIYRHPIKLTIVP